MSFSIVPFSSCLQSFPASASASGNKKKSTCQCRRFKRWGFNPWVGKVPLSRKWQPTPVFLCGVTHGWRSLAGYSPWSCKESDTTELLNIPMGVFTVKSLSCIQFFATPCSLPGSSIHIYIYMLTTVDSKRCTTWESPVNFYLRQNKDSLWETAPQIVLRNCSKQAVGEGRYIRFLWRGNSVQSRLTLWRRKWQPTAVFLPGKSHGWRSLAGYSPWGRKEWDTTEQLHFHTYTTVFC